MVLMLADNNLLLARFSYVLRTTRFTIEGSVVSFAIYYYYDLPSMLRGWNKELSCPDRR